jgi:hypothetical protein
MRLPDWLYQITYGLSEGSKSRILIDGTCFAVVQSPGGRWFDNSGGHYGSTSYHLADKQRQYRPAHGLLDCVELQHGGRAKLAQWKRLVTAADAAPETLDALLKELCSTTPNTEQ